MKSTGNSEFVGPKADEIEITVFGPGFGECIVVHFGNGTWGVIDSCIEPVTKAPVALNYLRQIGVNPEDIAVVVATHWHDDHIQGISQIVECSPSARFCCPETVNQKEFRGLMAIWDSAKLLPGGSGVNEIVGILNLIKSRSKSRWPSPVRASANKILWERSGSFPAALRALSPSDSAVAATIAEIGKILPQNQNVRRRIPNIGANDTSVVLSVNVGGISVLLGADLLLKTDPGFGWLAVLENANSTPPHQGYKVPHHGSHNGHHERICKELMVPGAWLCVTPFVNGNVRLPTPKDCWRLVEISQETYLTAPPEPTKFRDSDRAVEKTVRETTKSIQLFPGKFGYARFRKRISDNPTEVWSSELFGDAISIRAYILQQSKQ